MRHRLRRRLCMCLIRLSKWKRRSSPLNAVTAISGGRNRSQLDSLMRSSFGGSTMEAIEFPTDFIEFLRLLNSHNVEYLLVGGCAISRVGYRVHAGSSTGFGQTPGHL